ncbi:MAG: enoyl-CoA hydratase/isomerase family protein [Promethearchaeota archaeon]|nr:MAG: enoyl-CoA hydratase/isomerase family protein [Candidatus Lokiarchaeota archaeon]
MLIEDFTQIKYVKEENGLLTITLNWPEKKNALSPLGLLELWYAIDHAENDKDVEVLILTGCEEAGAFSSGGYFSEDMLQDVPKEYRVEINLRDMASKKLCLKFWDFPKPIIAAINGFAVGGGFTLPVICSDLVYMAKEAWWALYFIKRAVMPDFATTVLLPFIIGINKAKELFYFGDRMTAYDAEKLGLVNKVLPKEELMSYARKQALKLIPPKGPSLSIKLMKKTMHSYFREIIETQLDLENKMWSKAIRSKDFNESLKALKEKREPNFIGK